MRYEIWKRTGWKEAKEKRRKSKGGNEVKDHDLRRHDENRLQGKEDVRLALKQPEQDPIAVA